MVSIKLDDILLDNTKNQIDEPVQAVRTCGRKDMDESEMWEG